MAREVAEHLQRKGQVARTVTTKLRYADFSIRSPSFGVLTPEGRFVRFDDAGNTRVVEMLKSNKDWRNYMEAHKPVSVRVVGTPNGDVVVVKEIR